MQSHTSSSTEPVNEKKTDWKKHWRAHTALFETEEISPLKCTLLMTLLSIQGTNEDCWPCLEDLGRKCGSRKTVSTTLKKLAEEFPAILEISEGKGSASNRYKVKPMDKWPVSLIEKWESTKLHKNPNRRALTRNPWGKNTQQSGADLPNEPAVCGVKTTPLIGDSMEVANGVNVSKGKREDIKPKPQATAPVDLWAGF